MLSGKIIKNSGGLSLCIPSVETIPAIVEADSSIRNAASRQNPARVASFPNKNKLWQMRTKKWLTKSGEKP
jgi:hypothetical protein